MLSRMGLAEPHHHQHQHHQRQQQQPGELGASGYKPRVLGAWDCGAYRYGRTEGGPGGGGGGVA